MRILQPTSNIQHPTSGLRPNIRPSAHSCYDEILRIGIHTTSQGTLEKTALNAHPLGANTLQIFSAIPRMWRASPPSAPDVQLLHRTSASHDLNPLVIHINIRVILITCITTIAQK